MSAISIRAHFDGQHVVLDEPVKLAKDTPLMVTVLADPVDANSSDWPTIAASGLARAYGDDEPDYSAEDVKT
jgi:hypothetical protein